ncbi:uncharacterized protein N7511_009085 [Penicillium nucicola]|uniref:uncharacterized protein n=1 Tax=Penicillium nucicola TaxID=1850975 RepID=UPI0025456F64|nr:uncharacterized protein N7511_009085 [Penicillium nucicola]KAJ5747389.1 hypothetical protein N7511_009085 [Penicillium nucicola]
MLAWRIAMPPRVERIKVSGGSKCFLSWKGSGDSVALMNLQDQMIFSFGVVREHAWSPTFISCVGYYHDDK